MGIVEIPNHLKYKYRHMGVEPWSDRKIELPNDKAFYTVVAIMRANPPHINHTAMLKALCDKSVELKINIGSANKFDKKNPFKAEEREKMIDLALRAEYNNYSILKLPDFSNDDAWFNFLYTTNTPFSEIVSNNEYDLKIYKENQRGDLGQKLYDIIVPTNVLDQKDMKYVNGIYIKEKFVETKKPLYVSGTFVRAAMVNDWGWEDLVEKEIAKYIKKNDLVARIKEFCPELKGKPLDYFDDGR